MKENVENFSSYPQMRIDRVRITCNWLYVHSNPTDEYAYRIPNPKHTP